MTEKASFEQSLARLQSIVGALEQQEVGLSDSMKLFEEGLHLVEQCDQELKQFDEQIKVLLRQHEKGEK